MAEIIVNVGSDSPNLATYQDGDVVSAYNDRRISKCHAQYICRTSGSPFTTGGLRLSSGLPYNYRLLTSQIMFTRISRTEVRRDDLVTLVSDVLSDVQNAQNHYIHVQHHIDHLTASADHGVFGTVGAEIWFGRVGFRQADSDLLLVWNMIEGGSDKRKVDHEQLFLSDSMLSRFLVVPVVDVSDAEAEDMVKMETAVVDSLEIVVKKRRKFFPWESRSIGRSITDVRNKQLKIEIRHLAKHNANLVLK